MQSVGVLDGLAKADVLVSQARVASKHAAGYFYGEFVWFDA
jgi:hypothetical protein